jgi:hypothetical protein
MNVFSEYKRLDLLAQNYFDNNDFNNANLIAKKQQKIRNENFTKEDWEKLIAQSTGRAKYEYTRMMKEKFPD